MTIDREKFLNATGCEPDLDDLERSNCQMAGKMGHSGCGWCRHDLPVFFCLECFAERASLPPMLEH